MEQDLYHKSPKTSRELYIDFKSIGIINLINEMLLNNSNLGLK